jgi:ABC-type multidrug transport system ATPase subunit
MFRNLAGLQVTGRRISWGRLVSKTSLTAISGYVQQEDVFLEALTVREHLKFQSRVRMPGSMGDTARGKRVEQVIQELGLVGTADTRIAVISGGQKRRLSMASEILTDPALLFCDEPTSGLDSHMAASVVELLGAMARQGRTIVCTIHQPSSQVFATFDQLLLLAGGVTAYLGPARLAKEFFSTQGFPCPENYNPSDHMVSLLAVTPGREEADKARVSALSAAFHHSESGREILKAVRGEVKCAEEVEGKAAKPSPYIASWLQQFCALTRRNWLSTVKVTTPMTPESDHFSGQNPAVATVQIVQATCLTLLMGCIFFQQVLALRTQSYHNLSGPGPERNQQYQWCHVHAAKQHLF